MEIVRFLTVLLIGFALDLAVSLRIARFFSLPLSSASVIGFAIAAAFNYVLHELWTFHPTVRSLSIVRVIRYISTLAISLITRVGSIALLTVVLSDAQDLLILTFGAGLSFCTHYLISKHFVFLNSAGTKDHFL